MKCSILLAGLLGVSLSLAGPQQARAGISVGVSVDFFRDSLSPHGDWIESSRFGLVWAPRSVRPGWRPYTNGRWVYTDSDWTWVSDEEWGWATDHYGRWYFDRDEGWVWIPGDEWAPAWVVWRSGDDYVGWAPMPPDADPFAENFDVDLDPFYFSFVETRYLCEPHVYRRVYPVARNVSFVRYTRNETRYWHRDGRIHNRGVALDRVEHVLGHAVPRYRIQEVDSPRALGGARVRSDEVTFFRPRVEGSARVEVGVRRQVFDDRPDAVVRRHERERRDLLANEERERRDLLKLHERETKHPIRFFDNSREESYRHDADVRREEKDRGEAKRSFLDAARLRERHEAEAKAQTEHEQRDREVLQKRHEREQQAAQERHGHDKDQSQSGSKDNRGAHKRERKD
jgi:hypothetical protein